ncbi:unnamed protein product [Vicia faba]|uniref:Uncharacterized protein n=1 Tax=Vicia faba TaxID=3906 RepID=A0AAV0YV25_VICFA|nr:unnamed protein product [Vicia faba]
MAVTTFQVGKRITYSEEGFSGFDEVGQYDARLILFGIGTGLWSRVVLAQVMARIMQGWIFVVLWTILSKDFLCLEYVLEVCGQFSRAAGQSGGLNLWATTLACMELLQEPFFWELFWT